MKTHFKRYHLSFSINKRLTCFSSLLLSRLFLFVAEDKSDKTRNAAYIYFLIFLYTSLPSIHPREGRRNAGVKANREKVKGESMRNGETETYFLYETRPEQTDEISFALFLRTTDHQSPSVSLNWSCSFQPSQNTVFDALNMERLLFPKSTIAKNIPARNCQQWNRMIPFS